MNAMSDKNELKYKRQFKKNKNPEFSSSYQFYKMYSDGIGVEEDQEKSDHFKHLFVEQLRKYSFRVSNIKLINFKGFKELEISFSKQGPTVLIGNNGSGKSSILEALQKTLSHISSRLTTRSHNGDQIDELEINSQADFASIITSFSISELNIGAEICQSRPLSDNKKKSSFADLNELGNMFRIANSIDNNFPLPLIASYNVERANDVTTRDIEKSEEILDSYIWNKARGYSKSLTGRADFRLFFKWFKEITEIENESNLELSEIKIKIAKKEAELNSPLLKSIFSQLSEANPKTLSIVDAYKNEIEELKQKIQSSSSSTDNKMLDVVKNAIYSFLPGFSELKIQRNPLDLTVKKHGEKLSVLQLSQGEKSLLALVADIARRLTLLNPTRDNPLEGVGIVVIDEIDLHLHPLWQQNIISRLQETFKNIQFIITTHSPQVCHTISSENIILLKDGRRYRAPKGVQGAVSSWVLKNLFEVDERPPQDEYVIALKEYKKFVYSDEYNSPRAQELYNKLREHFGDDYEDLVDLKIHIENKEWEKSLDSGQ